MAGQIPDTGLPVGTLLTYNAQLDQSFLSLVRSGIGTADGLFQALTAPLSSKWGLQIVKTDKPFAVAPFSPEPITITVQMVGPETYAQPDDVRSIIDGEIINALSSNPIVSSNISSWTIPQSAGGSGQSVDTGAPAADTSVIDDVKQAASGAVDKIAAAAKTATSGLGLGTGIILIVLGTVAVFAIVVVVSPTAPARAAAGFARSRR